MRRRADARDAGRRPALKRRKLFGQARRRRTGWKRGRAAPLALVGFSLVARRPSREKAGGGAARLLARRCLALRLAFDAAHHPAQSRRPVRPADRLSLSQPVPRRPDRRPHPEPGDAERDHRLGHRLLRDGGHRRHHRRSGKAAQTRARPILRRRRGDRSRGWSSRSIPTGSARCCAAGFAHPHARPHLRPATAICCSIPRSIAARANILRNDLPPPGQDEGPHWLDGLRNLFHGRFNTAATAALRGYRRRQRPRAIRKWPARWRASRSPSCGSMRAARR